MKHFLPYFYIIIFSLTNGYLSAQDSTIYISLEKFPGGALLYSNYNTANYNHKGKSGKIQIEEFRCDFIIPKTLIPKKRYLLNRPMYIGLKVKNEYDISITQTNFHSFSWGIGLLEKMNNNWTLLGFVTPILASDFDKSLSSKDFIFESSALVYKRANVHLEYGFGYIYSTRFGKQSLWPVFSTIYKKNNWGLYMILPSYLSIFRDIKDSRVGLSCTIFRENYNFNHNTFSGNKIDKLSFGRINIGPEVELKLYKNIYLNAHTGYTVANTLTSITDHNGMNLELPNRWFLTFGLNLLVSS